MTTSNIKFAVLGFGHIGKRHAEEIHAHPDADLVAIIDLDKTARANAASAYSIPVFENMEEFIASGLNADIINICTPNGWHIPQAMHAIGNGFHVLVEKPVGLVVRECEELQNLSVEKGKSVFCVLQNRYSPPARLLKKLVSENSLGKILWVQVNCYWNRDARYYKTDGWRGTMHMDGGTLYTQFSHFVDLLYWAFGDFDILTTFFANCNHEGMIEFEDTGTFNFEFEKEGAGVFSYSTSVHGANMESSIIVLGEKGSVKIGGQYMEKLEFFNVEDMEAPALSQSNGANHYGSYQGSANNHSLVIDNVVKALQGESYEIATLDEAIHSVGIIERVYEGR